jgi:hypothetical protein
VSTPAATRTSLVKSLAYAAATLALSTWALAMLWMPTSP